MVFSPLDLGALVIATSFTAGLNVYLTVLALGTLSRLHWIALPPGLDSLAHTWIIVICGVLFTVEFIADKIPGLDFVWNLLHTFIRIPVAALIAYHATTQLSPPLQLLATAAGGLIALAAHSSKTAARGAILVSPEPLSNIVLSGSEDIAVIALTWFAGHFPIAAASTAIVLLLGIALATRTILRLLRTAWRRFTRQGTNGKGTAPAPSPQRPVLLPPSATQHLTQTRQPGHHENH